ncbi:hypothetical protein [Flavobacterium sp. LHD-85]|uniref:hypothetical protein n=1 Tax=Flavobacterium sp. LHD-85 TaxID=3071410 RepID=UPI0027DEFA23|nr:hypothetical protein [Flavobacterium sp. LHD-85]MDQ6531152.1 hypothetical protein [Flavobacterium sp. LHD-85]
MTNISFNLPDKYVHKKSQLHGIINSLKGDFTAIQTKDGIVYSIDFENEANGKEFNEKLSTIIPDIYKY